MSKTAPTIDLLLVTGMSGSGKSVALTALEDLGYYCVDNLPPELLQQFIALEQSHGARKVAIAIDVRSAASLPALPDQLDKLRQSPGREVQLRVVFLDATTDTLVRRFSETRRRHPLSLHHTDDDRHRVLTDAIEHERELLSQLREQAKVIDTSLLLPAQLRTEIKDLIGTAQAGLTLVFESFAFKRGIPIDADFVFDVRALPNPYYDLTLRPLNGRDQPVIASASAQPSAGRSRRAGAAGAAFGGAVPSNSAAVRWSRSFHSAASSRKWCRLTRAMTISVASRRSAPPAALAIHGATVNSAMPPSTSAAP